MTEARGEAPARLRRGRLQLIALFLVFFLPVLGALWLHVERAGWTPFGTTNHGELLRPPAQIAVTGLRSVSGQPVGDGLLRERWTLLLLTGAECGAACRRLLSDTRRVRWGLGKDMDRVQRLVVVREAAALSGIANLPGEQSDLELAVAEADWPGVALGLSGADSGALFVVDPRGYVVLRYPFDADLRGLLKDLERVLKISKVG